MSAVVSTIVTALVFGALYLLFVENNIQKALLLGVLFGVVITIVNKVIDRINSKNLDASNKPIKQKDTTKN